MGLTKKELKILKSIDLNKKQHEVVYKIIKHNLILMSMGWVATIILFGITSLFIGFEGGLKSEYVIPQHLSYWTWIPILLPTYLLFYILLKLVDLVWE